MPTIDCRMFNSTRECRRLPNSEIQHGITNEWAIIFSTSDEALGCAHISLFAVIINRLCTQKFTAVSF